MTKRQKEVLQASLTDEQAVLDALERNYTVALADVKRSIKALQANPLTQSRAYQLEYQQALERQISGALDVLQSQNFTTVAEYLQAAYTTSFVGSMYDMHGQGVPLLLPIDEATVLATVQKTGDDFKLSRKLGGDTDLLKRQVQDEITRGLASGSSYAKIARSITDYGEADYKRSARIARTEGHRVQNEARMHSMERAKKAGADVVKQWDATLDDTTRESHAKADGEIREMHEKFSNGLMFPGDPDGKAAEVVNCRCAMLVRARWALDEDELKTLQERAAYFGLDKTENFDDFRAKYYTAAQTTGINKHGKPIQYDFKGKDDKFAGSTEIIKSLSDEYSTRLEKVTVGAKQAAGTVDMSGSLMRLSSSRPETAIHEFAHTLANSNAQKYGLTDDDDFWKEIRSIMREYHRDVDRDGDVTRWISSYEHSSRSVDEFFAEAFTHAKMHELGLAIPDRYGSDFTYSDRVLAAVDKYFRRKEPKHLQAVVNGATINTVASNGLEVKELSFHAFQHMRSPERTVTMEDIIDAVEHPLHIGDIITDNKGRRSQRFIGNVATVNVNPDTGVVSTLWRTGKAARKKYSKVGE